MCPENSVLLIIQGVMDLGQIGVLTYYFGSSLHLHQPGVIGIVWISIGGLFDLSKRLATAKRNVLDDGRVSGDHNLADEASETQNDSEKTV